MNDITRIAIIGAGHVGATAAYSLMLRALCRELVLIDENTDLAKAEAADLADANALARPTHIWAGTYADAAQAQIAVITAGAASRGSESRLSLAARNAKVVRQCVADVVASGFDGVLVIAANPVDLMSLMAFRSAGIPSSKIIGTGTLLDTSRFKQSLAKHLQVAARSIEGCVIGEHGDSEVAAFSTVRIGGVGLQDFTVIQSSEMRDQIAIGVRDAGYQIITGKGYTSFGIATAIVRICETIVRDEREVLPVSTLLTGQYGISDVFLSLPCIIGSGGIADVLTPPLASDELQNLARSAGILKTAMAGLDESLSAPNQAFR